MIKYLGLFFLVNCAFCQENDSIQSSLDEKFETINLFHNNEVNSLSSAVKATITIKTGDGHGSGFFIGNSFVITNYHVVKDTNYFIGIDHEGNSIVLNLLRYDEDSDLALLLSMKESEYSFFLEEDNTLQGDEIFIIGCPSSPSLRSSIAAGIISGNRTLDEKSYYQIDARVNSGNSGGPLVDVNGKLIGVVTSKLVGFGVEGIGFAIPAGIIYNKLNLINE